uniref:Hexose transporter 1 n=1 Tax=Nannochloropsis gaditana (strain CCMP526) TaxID=1093141 RepID=I2CP18_NANGC
MKPSLRASSHAALDRLVHKESARAKHAITMNRSSSVSVGIGPSNLNRQDQSRRTFYEALPFTTVHGLQFKEHVLHKVLSQKSLRLAGEEATEESALLADVDVDQVIVTAPLAFAVFIAVIAEFLVGYNTSLMNAPEAVVFPGHTTAEWSLAVSAFAIGGPGGAILGGILANKRGRRGALLINALIFLVGGIILAGAPSIFWLIPARFIIGLASGFASVLVPIYLGELAPPTLRGTLGTLTQFSLVTGILVSDVLAYPLATAQGWRFLFAVTALLACLQLLCSPFLLESPRWLLARDEKSRDARVIMKKLRGFREAKEVEMEVEHMMMASRRAKTPHNSAHSASALYDLFRDPSVRLLLISCLVLQISQQLCGINAVFYYSTMFFQGLIADPLEGTILVASVNVIATYVALKLMDTCGRRTLVLWSASGMLFSCVMVTMALYHVVPDVVALLGVMLFVFFFEIGLGPIPWLIVAEMFDQKYVATSMSLSCQVNWACNFIIGIGFPFINAWLGKASFVPFGIVLALTLSYTYFYLPETLGRTVQEIQQLAAASTNPSTPTNMRGTVEGKFPASSENKHRPSYGTNGKGEGGKEEGRKQRVVQSVEAGDLALQV